MAGLRRVVAPPEVLSLEDVKVHLRESRLSEEPLIARQLRVAHRVVEEKIRPYALGPQTWEQALDAWPTGALALPLQPLVAVVSITAHGDDGSSLVLPSTAYVVDVWAEPGRVWITPPATAPTLRRAAGVVLRFTCGWDAADVPEPILEAIAKLTAHAFMFRGDDQNPDTTVVGPTWPPEVEELLEPWITVRI